tara:strand:+ start:267 stop:659 length:393 start_codon:yes stop_codon:yes gene_type:complete
MGILSNILGSGDVIKRGMDLIDGFHTSETEAIEAKTQAKVQMLSAYAPFKIAQRVIALSFTAVFLLCFLICLTATLYSFAADGFNSAEIVEAVTALMEAFKLPWAMLAILGFYFGGGAFEGYQASKSEKK